MISIIFGFGCFLCVVAYAIHINGWSPSVRRHPVAALLVIGLCAGASWLGATKPPATNDPPVIVHPPDTPAVILRFYRDSDEKLYSIDALLKEAFRD